MPAPDEIQEKVSPAAAQPSEDTTQWGDISRAVTEGALVGAAAGAGAAASGMKNEINRGAIGAAAEAAVTGAIAGGAALAGAEAAKSLMKGAKNGATDSSLPNLKLDTPKTLENKSIDQLRTAEPPVRGAYLNQSTSESRRFMDDAIKLAPRAFGLSDDAPKGLKEFDRKKLAEDLMKDLAEPRKNFTELLDERKRPLPEMMENAGGLGAMLRAAVKENALPADLNTLPELKQVGADHGKETASRTAGKWTISNHADGVEVWKNSDTGTKMSKLPDGTNVTEFKNGTVSIIKKDGTSITRNDGTGVMTYNRPDGSGVLQFKDGKREPIAKPDPSKDPYEKQEFKAQPDGSKVYENDWVKVTRTNDGKQVELLKESGVTNTTTKDGSKVTEYKDGTKISKLADGTELTEGKDYSMKKLPDGTVINDERKSKYQYYGVTKPDGSSVTEFNNGDIVTKTADGKETKK